MSSFGFDPDRAMDRLRKLAADAPSILADGFERVVRETPPERLEQLMRSPARKAALEGIFWQMPKQVNHEVAKEMSTVIRWCLTGRADDGTDVYQLEIDRGIVRTSRGEQGEPKLTVTMDAVEFLRLASGNLDPMQAYFRGKIRLTGDIMAAAKLAQLFKMPGARNGASVHDEEHDLPDEDSDPPAPMPPTQDAESAPPSEGTEPPPPGDGPAPA